MRFWEQLLHLCSGVMESGGKEISRANFESRPLMLRLRRCLYQHSVVL